MYRRQRRWREKWGRPLDTVDTAINLTLINHKMEDAISTGIIHRVCYCFVWKSYKHTMVSDIGQTVYTVMALVGHKICLKACHWTLCCDRTTVSSSGLSGGDIDTGVTHVKQYQVYRGMSPTSSARVEVSSTIWHTIVSGLLIPSIPWLARYL